MFDPTTATGTVILNIIAGIGLTAIVAVLSWIIGPLKWLIQTKRLRKIIGGECRFRFVYNPDANKSKIVTFLPDGQIGEGRNENENKWRIKRGKLEILAVDGKWFNRFKHDPETGRIVSTNELSMRSINGQYFIPIWERPKYGQPK